MKKNNNYEMVQGDKNRYWILLAVGIGTFMSALDGSVVNTALPVIEKYFSAKITTVEWAVVIYLLSVSSLLLTFGRLGDIRGHKRVYLTGFIIFIAGSALCGLAPNATLLVIFRGLQSIGAAMLFANSPAILTKSFSPFQRGQALGIQGTMTYLGLMVGPSLGGFLTQRINWRAVFYINVPVGLLAFILSVIFISSKPAETKEGKFDIPGALVFMTGLISFLLALNQGNEWGWTSPVIIGLLLFGFLLLGVFVRIELRKKHPMLDLRLFRDRIFAAGTTSAILNYIGVYSITFMMPFYLIQGRGLNPEQAGLLLTAQPLMMAIIAPISGTISDKIGSRIPSTLGMFFLTVGMVLLSTIRVNTPLTTIIIFLAIAGIGTGIFVSPNNSAIMGSAPRNRQGIAAGVLATARNMGMVLGVGIAGAFLSANVQQSINLLFPQVRAGFVVAGIIAFMGCLASAIRGQENDRNNIKSDQLDKSSTKPETSNES
jgi:EmrB/QacA subfamily drug resistance transporter